MRALGFGPRAGDETATTARRHRPAGSRDPRGDPRAPRSPRDQRRGRRPWRSGRSGRTARMTATTPRRCQPCRPPDRPPRSRSHSASPPPTSGIRASRPTDRVTVRVAGRTVAPGRVSHRDDRGRARRSASRRPSASPFAGWIAARTRSRSACPAAAEVTVDTASGWNRRPGPPWQQRYRTASGDVRLSDTAGGIEVESRCPARSTVELGAGGPRGPDRVGRRVGAWRELTSLRLRTTSGDVRLDSPLGGTGPSRSRR